MYRISTQISLQNLDYLDTNWNLSGKPNNIDKGNLMYGLILAEPKSL